MRSDTDPPERKSPPTANRRAKVASQRSKLTFASIIRSGPLPLQAHCLPVGGCHERRN
jgi:hypothetical protein